MKKTGLKGIVKVFSVDCNSIDTNDILEINRYLMQKSNIKQCLKLLKKCLFYY